MSTLLAVSKFLGSCIRERRRVDSTSNLVPINTLGSANDVIPQGAPKNPRSNCPTSSLPAWSLHLYSRSSLGGPGRTPSSNHPPMTIPCHDPPYLRTVLDVSLLSNTNAPSGSAETNDGEGKLRQSQMQNAELDRAKKCAQDPEQEGDRALIHARDARDVQEKAQMRILELEDTLNLWRA
ncbi:hypothetical protein BDN70DRAFT_998802 [Pholiota conissans]|uniref:Uncharacterized protein n=1 Tax=Pholiota conissans TaxID=109636 RepID=A0A9P5YNK9_9AGAR|nr:hypothetical protein BDN70DRAFT_998802 [Pholiota conissans]